MNYLFFDCEFASSLKRKEKICEFGYTLVDEKFNFLKSENFIINPNIPNDEWDWYALKKILTRKKEEYLNKENFLFYHKRIIDLFENADLIFGYSVCADVHAINCELERYQLPCKNFVFYDVKELYCKHICSEKGISLENALKEQNIFGNQKYHDAEADSYNTMLLATHLANRSNLSLLELLESCSLSKDQTCNFVIESLFRIEQARKERRRQKKLLKKVN